MARILDGRIVRDSIRAKLSAQVRELAIKPKLVILQVGNFGATEAYVKQKKLFGESIGALVDHRTYPDSVSKDALLADIATHNADASVHGIILQLPIPKNLSVSHLIEAIDPMKDVDGLHSVNVKKLWEGDTSGFTPATARGVLSLLDYYEIPLAGKRVAVLGRSSLVGKPLAVALIHRDATVTVCHRKTLDLNEETKRAEIIIVATGRQNLITKDSVSQGQVVIDVGINIVSGEKLAEEITGTKLVGDVDFEGVKDIVEAISPVPGGVGPMTVASLFENLLKAYQP